MYLAIIILPLLGSIVSGFFGRKVGVSGAQLITCSCVIITTILAILAFFEVGLNNIPVSIQLFRWIDSESLNVSWGFHFDSLTVSMLIPVLIVSSLVHVYSIGYMSHDPHNQRFFSYLSLFTFMMIILVTANNFLLMFVGWEGVGVCSYLLVCFWFTRIAANQSSISAFLTNRVGDCFLTIGMFAILWSFGNVDYATVFSLAPYISENIVTIIGICLLIGAMAKSSQVGLHVWLPMAMEGPTPVSALIHAATMVTAGVYLLMRSSPLIEYSSTVLLLCLWLGAITTVFSSLIGLFQQDIKKVIAYSTMSQLGMMVIAVGLSSYNVALFHLVNHAFYKALLFLGAGSVIHSVADNQDFRKYGGLISFLPLTYSVMLIASLSLVAFPFMTGFYSKDFILESAYGQFYFSGTVVYFIATIGAMFTTLYSVKVLYLTFLTNPNGPLVNYKTAHEGDIFMSLPLIILAVFSIFFGYITKEIFIGLGSGFFSDNGLFIHPSHEIMLDTEFAVPTFFKLLPLMFTVSLSVIALILSEFLPKVLIDFKLSRVGYNIFSFFNQRFLIELFYNKYVTNIVLKLGGQTTKVLDKGSIETIGPYGIEKGLLNLSKNIASLDTGVITSYALYILVGLIFYILVPYFFVIDNSIILIILFGLLNIKTINSSSTTTTTSSSKNTSNWFTNPSKLDLTNPYTIKSAMHPLIVQIIIGYNMIHLISYLWCTSYISFIQNYINSIYNVKPSLPCISVSVLEPAKHVYALAHLRSMESLDYSNIIHLLPSLSYTPLILGILHGILHVLNTINLSGNVPYLFNKLNSINLSSKVLSGNSLKNILSGYVPNHLRSIIVYMNNNISSPNQIVLGQLNLEYTRRRIEIQRSINQAPHDWRRYWIYVGSIREEGVTLDIEPTTGNIDIQVPENADARVQRRGPALNTRTTNIVGELVTIADLIARNRYVAWRILGLGSNIVGDDSGLINILAPILGQTQGLYTLDDFYERVDETFNSLLRSHQGEATEDSSNTGSKRSHDGSFEDNSSNKRAK